MDVKTALVLVGLTIPFIAMSLWAIINASRKEFGSLQAKAIWMLVAAIPFIGFFIYLIFGLKRGRRPGNETSPQNNV